MKYFCTYCKKEFMSIKGQLRQINNDKPTTKN